MCTNAVMLAARFGMRTAVVVGVGCCALLGGGGWLVGCGGIISEPEEEESVLEDAGADGASGGDLWKTGSCNVCRGEHVCSFCFIQNYEKTYVCPANSKAPRSNCMFLDEKHTSDGFKFTCYYCG